jgi:apolipoprotein N-acyltransferase|tara:strand:- start:406 stop:1959 length:1554 start_codon:yes stop_codon:yes gene_type:complete
LKKIINFFFIIYWLLPFVLGILTAFSLPPYNFVIINFITFPFLLFIIFELRKEKKKIISFFQVGWLYGFGYFLSNLYWITYSLTHDKAFKIFIPIALFLIPAFLAIFYGIFVSLLFKININKRLTSILIFSIFFSVIEFIRGNILSGFPWNLISFSWIASINFIQILSLIGTYSFNLISITIFSLPFIFIFKKLKKTQISVLFILLTIISTNYFYGVNVINKSNKKSLETLNYNIKIISPKISIDKYIHDIDNEHILNDLIKLSNPNDNLPTIFVWPEGALSGIYFDELKNYSEIFSKNFSDNHIIIMGISTRSLKDKEIYNSMVVINNKLDLINKYNKNKLVPFGEFLPFENFFNSLGFKKITYGYESFSNGKKRDLISINNSEYKIQFLPLICYEIIYSGFINSNKENFDLIINISEDGWFGNSIGPDQHFSHSIFRAIEEGKNIIRSANNGISAYISSNGEIINRIESTQRGVIKINKLHISKNTFFSEVGNKMFFYFIIFYITLIFFINKKES